MFNKSDRAIVGAPGEQQPLQVPVESPQNPEKQGINLSPGVEAKPQQAPPPSVEPYKNIPDPCLQRGLTLPARVSYIDNEEISFMGTGDYHKCQESLVALLNLSRPCDVDPCSMNGVHQPPISFKNSEFYGFSEFWYTMEDVYRIGGLYEHDVFDAQATVSQYSQGFFFRKLLYLNLFKDQIRKNCNAYLCFCLGYEPFVCIKLYIQSSV